MARKTPLKSLGRWLFDNQMSSSTPTTTGIRPIGRADRPIIYCTSTYFLDLRELWTDWPQRELNGLTKGYMLVQGAFWLQQVMVINMESRRRDHRQMMAHHIVTIALLWASYVYHQTRVGTLILVTMDVVDLIFPVSLGFDPTNRHVAGQMSQVR